MNTRSDSPAGPRAGAPVTVGAALHDGAERLRAAAIEDADLEADVLLRHALAIDDDRAHLFARLREPIDGAALAEYDRLLRRRLDHEPAAYIVSFREFYGLKLACTADALLPRPETELLVEIALEWLSRAQHASSPLIVDVGTGTGALAIALAVHCAPARIVALDSSLAALRLAARNAGRHRVRSRVAFVCGDLLSAISAQADVIVANLPYVSAADWRALPPEIREHEPRAALVGGPSGTQAIRRLLGQAPPRLRARSLLLCECGDGQGAALRIDAGAAFPDARIEVRHDLAGLDRVLCVER